MRRITTILLILISLICRAQLSKPIAFTVNDGLPSNHIYRCIEDNKGFLWVATDAGIARFDGKKFQVFGTAQGLADNEVLSVVKEKNGRLWVNLFRQGPSYFDEILNRFVNIDPDTNGFGMFGTAVMYLYPLPGGGVQYSNENGSFVFKNEKFIDPKGTHDDHRFLIRENADGSQLRWSRSKPSPRNRNSISSAIFYIKGKSVLDSIQIPIANSGNFLPAISESKFYLIAPGTNKCYIYSGLKLNPLRFDLDSITVPEPYFNFAFTGTSIYMVTNTGKIYVFNKRSLGQEYQVSGNYLPNSFYNDKLGNLWIPTIDKGLVLYKKNILSVVKLPSDFIRTNFLSIARKADGTWLAGNYYGEVLEWGKGPFRVNTIVKKVPSRQRKILISENKIFTFSEERITRNYGDPLLNLQGRPYSTKDAIRYNDSLIIAGTYRGFLKLNAITEKITRLGTVSKRITTLVKAGTGIIYFGSTDGLYKYNFLKDSVTALAKNHLMLSKRVIGLCITPDKLLWVASPGNGIIVVQNDKVLMNITDKNGIISNSSRSISSGKPGQVWLGTSQGISKISYRMADNKLKINIQNVSVNDGLSSNEINEMLYQNDTVYAATSDGISIIPADISIPNFNIPVYLVGISINQRDTSIFSKYDLGRNQKNIQMQFAGIELGGHFKNFQYTLNKNGNWITLDENTLALQLNNGTHLLQVRAVDVNGNIGSKILTIQFNVATPYWKTIWFWIIFAVLIQVPIIYVVNRRQKKRKEAKLAKQIAEVQIASLEQQAFTSLMNPHFVFNALNSVQHYINVQDRQNANSYLSDFASLIRQNFEAAQLSFIPLEQEIENIKIYLRLEKMRFKNRLEYHIIIEENVEIDDWMVPTMILQPLLENALLHGIMPSNTDGELLVILKMQDSRLEITITDNGIGMINSLALKDKGSHKSRGMELIMKRIGALGRFGTNQISIEMTPAFENERNPGNKIILLIPAELHSAWLRIQKQ